MNLSAKNRCRNLTKTLKNTIRSEYNLQRKQEFWSKSLIKIHKLGKSSDAFLCQKNSCFSSQSAYKEVLDERYKFCMYSSVYYDNQALSSVQNGDM